MSSTEGGDVPVISNTRVCEMKQATRWVKKQVIFLRILSIRQWSQHMSIKEVHLSLSGWLELHRSLLLIWLSWPI